MGFPKPQNKKQEKILQCNTDLCVIGGAAYSGKTFLLNCIPLRYIKDSHFNGIAFRRTSVQSRGLGGMWDTACEIYSGLPEKYKPKQNDSNLRFTFPTKARMVHSHLEHEKNKYDHQGLQYSLELWDEGTHFTFTQFEYLFSRLRSGAEGDSRSIISCNPDPDSWVFDLVEWYLDDEGYPHPDKDGVIRYFVRKGGDFIWSNDPRELYKYCDKNERPMSFTALFANIYDNPIGMKKNPSYLSFLKGLNETDKARLLYGNWFAREKESSYFDRDWLIKLDRIPNDKMTCVRSWDKAATEPSDVNPYPDFTACIKMYKNTEGDFIITGEYHPDVKDDKLEISGKFRKRPGKRDNLILKQAIYDDTHCLVILPEDSASAGKSEYIESSRKLAQNGFIVRKDPAVSQASKLSKFQPFSAAAENGHVYIVESTFDKKTLDAFYKELESFTGASSGKLRKDDWVDCVATAYNYLSQKTVIPDFKIPRAGVNSKLVDLRSSM